MRRRHQHIGHRPHGEHGDGDADQAARVRIGGESHDENQGREREVDPGRAIVIELPQSGPEQVQCGIQRWMAIWLSDGCGHCVSLNGQARNSPKLME